MRADGWVLAVSVLATCALGACEHGDVGPASNFQTLRTCADHGGLSIECRSASGPTVGVASVAPPRSDRGRGARTCRRRKRRGDNRRLANSLASSGMRRGSARTRRSAAQRTRSSAGTRPRRWARSHTRRAQRTRTPHEQPPPHAQALAHVRVGQAAGHSLFSPRAHSASRQHRGEGSGSPEARDAVLPQDGILGDEDHLSLQSLRDQQAIEGITMMIR